MPNIKTKATGAADTPVPTSRRVDTLSPLQGGGDLSQDRTISLATTEFVSNPTDGPLWIDAATDAQRVVSSGELAGFFVLADSNTVTGPTQVFDYGVEVWMYDTVRQFGRVTFGAEGDSVFSPQGDLQVSGTSVAYRPMYQGRAVSAQRYVTSGELAAGGGTGTVTHVYPGSNVEAAPNPITTSGSIGLQNPLTGPLWIGAATNAQRLVTSGELTAFFRTLQSNIVYGTPQVFWSDVEVSINDRLYLGATGGTRFSAAGDFQASGTLRSYGRADDLVVIGDGASNYFAAFWGAPNAGGTLYQIQGSGLLTGSLQLQALTPQDVLFLNGLRLLTETNTSSTFRGGVQASGTLRTYDTARFGRTGGIILNADGSVTAATGLFLTSGQLQVTDDTLLRGFIANTGSLSDGVCWQLLGSGLAYGSVRFLRAEVGDLITSEIPVYGNASAIAANRYVTSGELVAAGSGTGDALRAQDNFWTGSQNVFSPATAVTISGALYVPAAAGSVQISGGLSTYGAVRMRGSGANDRIIIGDPTGNNTQILRGAPNTSGVWWSVTGSGTITGEVTLAQQLAGDALTIKTTPVRFTTGATLTALDTQISGTLRAYRPMFQGQSAAAQRYVTSGELDAFVALSGRSGGQTIIGGTGSGDDLTLQSTSHATKGNLFLDDAVALWPSFPNPPLGSTTYNLLSWNPTFTVSNAFPSIYGLNCSPTVTISSAVVGMLYSAIFGGGTFTNTVDSLSVFSLFNAGPLLTTATTNVRPMAPTIYIDNAIYDVNNVSVASTLADQIGFQHNATARVRGAAGSATFGSLVGFKDTTSISATVAGGVLNLTTRAAFTCNDITYTSTGTVNVTNNVGLDLANMVVGTSGNRTCTNVYGIRSALASGTNRWFLYGSGTAVSAHAGAMTIGAAAAPTTSALLDLSSTTGALLVPRMTTAQRDALTAANGMIVYNSTTNAFNFYENGAWVTK